MRATFTAKPLRVDPAAKVFESGAVFRKWFATPDAIAANWRKMLLPFTEGHSRKQSEEVLKIPTDTVKRDTKWHIKRTLRKTKTSKPGDIDPHATL